MNLKTLQTQFIGAMLNSQETAIEQAIKAPTLQMASDKINLYRQSRIARIYKVLRSTYPVCEGLVGENYFKQLCFFHAKQDVSQDHDISLCGKNFPSFLAQPSHNDLVYLPDVARFEWACFSVLYGSYMQPLDVAKLSEYSKESHPKLKFSLGATHVLFATKYPVFDIWRQHFKPEVEHLDIDLAIGGATMLIYRQGWTLKVDVLSELEAYFLGCFKSNFTFEHTWEKCESAFPRCNLTALFAKAVERGWINDVIYDAKQND